MAEPKWTKGPYTFEPENGRVYAGRLIVAFVAGGNPDREANGPLLAVAPELYDVADWAAQRLDVDGGMTEAEQKTTLERILSVLAKARGETP